MELIDTHCHLDAAEFIDYFNAKLNLSKSTHVSIIIIPGVIQAGWTRILNICKNNTGLFAALGLHPMFLSQHKPSHLDKLRKLVQQDQLIAIGEIGLDFYIENTNRTAQQDLFEEQLQIANSATLPLLLHVRKSHDQILASLRKNHFPHGGIVHAFSGSYQQAKQYIALGFGLGFGGTLTYNRAKRIRAIATKLPQKAIVLETDAPDLPPANHKGKINRPEYLPEILTILATLRNESPEETAQYTTANAKRILKLMGSLQN